MDKAGLIWLGLSYALLRPQGQNDGKDLFSLDPEG